MEIVSFAINLEHIGDIIDKNLCELAIKKIKRRVWLLYYWSVVSRVVFRLAAHAAILWRDLIGSAPPLRGLHL